MVYDNSEHFVLSHIKMYLCHQAYNLEPAKEQQCSAAEKVTTVVLAEFDGSLPPGL